MVKQVFSLVQVMASAMGTVGAMVLMATSKATMVTSKVATDFEVQVECHH